MAHYILMALVMGIGATALLDLWALLLNRLFAFGLPNWALVGRWALHLPFGRLMHDDISLSRPFRNELAAGWLFHYFVGICFAIATLLLGGIAWATNPTWPLPMAIGLITVGLGWFVLQPGLGNGMAASKKPDRVRIRILNVLGHIVFGLGLWWSALLFVR